MPYAVATREPDRAAAFLEALGPLGLVGVAMPVTTTVAVDDLAPLAAALAALQPGELVALASARASQLVVEQLARTGLALPHVAWWAVGESSAAPLRQLGYSVATAPRSSATGLAEAILAAASATSSPPLSGLRVLLPRAEDGRDEAALALRAAGARVDELVVYRTAPLPFETPALQAALAHFRAGEVAVAALFAPSQVTALQSALVAAGLSLATSPALFAAIGDTTAQALAAAGVAQLVVASAPTPQAMANAVASRYPPRR